MTHNITQQVNNKYAMCEHECQSECVFVCVSVANRTTKHNNRQAWYNTPNICDSGQTDSVLFTNTVIVKLGPIYHIYYT